jgi:hypothetical protein
MTLNFRTEFLASTFYEKNLVASILLIKYSLYGPGDKSREKIKTSFHIPQPLCTGKGNEK